MKKKQYMRAIWYLVAGIILLVTTWAGTSYEIPAPPLVAARVTELPEDGDRMHCVLVAEDEAAIESQLRRLAGVQLHGAVLHAYTPADPLYKHRWAKLGDAGPLPQFWIVDALGNLVYKSSGGFDTGAISQCLPTFDESRGPRRILPDIKPQVSVNVPAGVRWALWGLAGFLVLSVLTAGAIVVLVVVVVVLRRLLK